MMIRRFKKLFLAILGLAMMASVVSTFVMGKNSETKVQTIHVLYDFNTDPQGMSLTNNKYVNYIEAQTGVKIQIESPGSAGYSDKLNILMASGDTPDAVTIYNKDTVMKFAEEGLLMDLTPFIKKTAKYPNIKKYMPAQAWLPVKDGNKIWAFPNNRQDAFNQCVYIRKDWLAKLHLKTPKTIDDFYNVMKAFTYNDPDGNGKQDTFGLLAKRAEPGQTYNGLEFGGRMFMAAFDCSSYKIIAGKVTPPEITPQYKDYLAFMAKLVKEKIMDPEYAITTIPINIDKLKTGKYGMTSNFWHGDQLPEYKEKRIHEVWDAIDFPLRRDGKPAKLSYATVNRHYVAIPKNSKNPAAVMKLLDWAVSPEGLQFTYLGIPNNNYRINNDKIEIIDQAPGWVNAFNLVKAGILNDKVKSYMAVNYPQQTIDRLTLATRNGQLDKLYAALPFNPELASYDLDSIVAEFREKVILGNADLDKEWNEYVARWKKAGGDKAIQFWTDWYNKAGKKMVK